MYSTSSLCADDKLPPVPADQNRGTWTQEDMGDFERVIDTIRSENLQLIGRLTDKCIIENQSLLYKLVDAKSLARRNFLEKTYKVYGVSLGIRSYYPNFPENLFLDGIKFEGYLLHGTVDCGEDLSYEQAKEFGAIYNQEMVDLITK